MLERERRQQEAATNVSPQEEAKKTTSRRQSSTSAMGNNQPQRSQVCPRSQNRSTVEARLKCFNCQELGHKAAACPKQPVTNKRPAANLVTAADEESSSLVLLMDGKGK